jgi:hypothetical protein
MWVESTPTRLYIELHRSAKSISNCPIQPSGRSPPIIELTRPAKAYHHSCQCMYALLPFATSHTQNSDIAIITGCLNEVEPALKPHAQPSSYESPRCVLMLFPRDVSGAQLDGLSAGDTIRVRAYACKRCMPVRCKPVRRKPVRCKPVRRKPVRCMPVRCKPVRCMPATDHAC